jgi:hypothetical protein
MLLVATAGLDGFFIINYSFLVPLLIVVAAFFLIGIVYHIDRENDWKKEQQTLPLKN